MTQESSIPVDHDLYGSSRDPFLQGEDEMSVAELIPRILSERKSMLNITERLLEEELRRKEDRDLDMEEAAEGDMPEEDDETAFQQFQKQTMDLLGHINSALNETSLSLDFVSLLMSAEKPNITKSTISPHLTKSAPLGSLSSDRLHMSKESKEAGAGPIGLGWKYQSLTNIKTLFKDAADLLKEQLAAEENYWNTINRVLSHGEVLFKMRDPETNGRAIGVKYGYGDSGSSYYDKGLAILRKTESTGDVQFVPIATGSNKLGKIPHKFIRVRILSKIDDDYMLTGQSVFDKKALEIFSDDPVVSDIERARFFLFEEDLFYHLTREAKNLMNYNISIISNKIIVDLIDQIIEIESVVYDENNEEELMNLYQNTSKESSKDNAKAQDILAFLKLMLCCYFQYNLDLKQKIPTSFTKWKQGNSHPLLLRPLIGHIRHQNSARSVNSIVDNLCKRLDPALVNYEVEEQLYYNLKNEKTSNTFQKAVQRPLSRFEISLRKNSGDDNLKVDLELTTSEIFVDVKISLTVTRFGSAKDLEQNHNGSNLLSLKFTDLAAMEESLDWTFLSFMDE